MFRTLIRPIAGLSAALALCFAAAPAYADTWHSRDADNPDVGWGDVAEVRADHAPRNVFADVRFHSYIGRVLAVWIDADPDDRGPEYVYRITATDSDAYGALYRVNRFGDRGREMTWCDGASDTVSDNLRTWSVKAPRRCLKASGKAPAKVRVSVESRSGGGYDWTPKRNGWGPWLARG